MFLEGMQNIAIAIYFEAMYLQGCEIEGLPDDEMNRQAFLLALQDVALGYLRSIGEEDMIPELQQMINQFSPGIPEDFRDDPYYNVTTNPLDHKGLTQVQDHLILGGSEKTLWEEIEELNQGDVLLDKMSPDDIKKLGATRLPPNYKNRNN